MFRNHFLRFQKVCTAFIYNYFSVHVTKMCRLWTLFIKAELNRLQSKANNALKFSLKRILIFLKNFSCVQVKKKDDKHGFTLNNLMLFLCTSEERDDKLSH